MHRTDLEHVIGAIAQIVKRDEFVVIGSQAIHGTTSNVPGSLLQSMEVDVYVPSDPEASDLIDVIGDGSAFHQTFGYYAHGVGPETLKAPKDWERRLVALEIPPRPGSDSRSVAWCLEVHDLVLAKCAACRERDWEYARAAIGAGLVNHEVLMRRAQSLPVPERTVGLVVAMLAGMRQGTVPPPEPA